MATPQPREESIFNIARKIDPGDGRKAILNEACAGDTALRKRVEELLAAYDEESQFLEQPAPELAATVLPQASGDDLADVLDAGRSYAFDEDSAVVVGNANHSVLTALGQTVDVPRVMLREATEDDPILRPRSDEIPDHRAEGRYRLDGEIARGGMGAIIKGRDTDLGRDLAIKVLLDAHKNKPDVVQRFIEEAQIGGQLQHPGIAPVYELGQFADARPFFSMKLVKGQTLAALLSERDNPGADRTKFLGIFEQVCQTMAYAHSRGVIHRDLKPANIMVGAFGEVQVMDWGLAKVLSVGGVTDEKKSKDKQQGQSIVQTLRSIGSDLPATVDGAGSQTQMGSVMGTPAYMPPEQALGEIDQLNERADVFGLGAILSEILTGNAPYVGKNGTQVFRLASRGRLDDCFQRLEACDADPKLIALTRHCLELEPGDRPRNAGALAEQVTGYLESVETKLRQAEMERATQAARAEEERKRRRVSMALAATVVLALMLGGGGWMWIESERSQRKLDDAQRSIAEASRLGRNAEAVAVLLRQGEESLRDWDADKAAVALDAARKRSAEGGAEKQADRLKSLTADLDVLRKLDAVDQFRWTWVDGEFPGWAKVAERTRDALQPFGAYPDATSVDEAAARVSNSVVRRRIVQALDRLLKQQNAAVRALLRRLDADDYRNAFRDALHAREWAKLVELAGRKDALKQPPEFTAFLGDIPEIPLERRRKVLQVAVSQRPGDLPLLMLMARTNGSDVDDLSAGVDERIRWYQAALAADPKNVAAHINIGREFGDVKRDSDRAIACFKKAIELDPTNAIAHNNLGNVLDNKGRLDEAIACFKKAIDLDPTIAAAQSNMGRAMSQQGRLEEAIAYYRKSIALAPMHPLPRFNLGRVLARQGHLDEALTCFTKAIELKPTDSEAHFNVGAFLIDMKRDYDGAIIWFRKAIALNPKVAKYHFALADTLVKKDRFDESIASFHSAIALDPKRAESHCNLGNALAAQGRFAESLAAYRRGHELGIKQTGWKYPSADWVRNAEKKAVLEDKIPAFRKGEFQPRDNIERLQMADLCRVKKLYHTTSRLYAAIFTEDPKLADETVHRYNAACFTSLAATGQGKESAMIDDKERRRLRKQALNWLRADLTLRARQLESNKASIRAGALQFLRIWQKDSDLTGLRDEAALAELPADERAACTKLWTDVAALIKKAETKTDK